MIKTNSTNTSIKLQTLKTLELICLRIERQDFKEIGILMIERFARDTDDNVVLKTLGVIQSLL